MTSIVDRVRRDGQHIDARVEDSFTDAFQGAEHRQPARVAEVQWVVVRVGVGHPGDRLSRIVAQELRSRRVIDPSAEVYQPCVAVRVLPVVAERRRRGPGVPGLVAIGVVGEGSFRFAGRACQKPGSALLVVV